MGESNNDPSDSISTVNSSLCYHPLFLFNLAGNPLQPFLRGLT
jgi:hypothetical protein